MKKMIGLAVAFFVLACDPKATPPTAAAPTMKPAPAEKRTTNSAATGPASPVEAEPHKTGDVASGKEVFRFETFGNEGFWTDAVKMPAGMKRSKVTPLMALKAGLMIDVDVVEPAMRTKLAAELKTDMSAKSAPTLNDPMAMGKLVSANAIIGMVTKDSNKDGKLDIAMGDKVGVTCAICHTITDESGGAMPNGGSIGKRIDGPANLVIDMGTLLAIADNSRALYPNLQLELGGKTIGRAPKGLTEKSTEAEVDAYLKNPEFYPVGTFDETNDGIGNPVKNVPVFRTDLAAPWGTAAEHAILDGIGNGSYTTNLDLSTLATPEGKKFLMLKGGAAGVEISEDYAKVLAETGVKKFPFVVASMDASKIGTPERPHGRRVDDQKLFDLNAYFDSLQAPKGVVADAAAGARGKMVFQTNCTSCHEVDSSRPVSARVIPMKTIFPAYAPKVLAPREKPLGPIVDSPGTYDDKMVVVDATDRGIERGIPVPLLLDLARTTVFLHDASVKSIDALMNPTRGPMAPHPFYLEDPDQRGDVAEFLRGMEARPAP